MFDEYEKGDLIPAHVIEKYLGIKRDTKDYPLKLLNLREDLMRQRERDGKPVTICVRRHGLAILTDAQASKYNHSSAMNRLRAHRRCCTRLRNVEIANLNSEQLSEHDYRVAKQNDIQEAIRRELRRNREQAIVDAFLLPEGPVG